MTSDVAFFPRFDGILYWIPVYFCWQKIHSSPADLLIPLFTVKSIKGCQSLIFGANHCKSHHFPALEPLKGSREVFDGFRVQREVIVYSFSKGILQWAQRIYLGFQANRPFTYYRNRTNDLSLTKRMLYQLS